ncbi:MAG: type II toxin-antitoxin system VapC family toxin [Proteobacteria bacterium]|nr:type II toxin-antitoxin system VapC family toxin [Pseudomonadota bacterium]
MFLLDTNVCIHLLNGTKPQIIDEFKKATPAQIILCGVVKAELLYGARNSMKVEDNLQLLNRFFAPLNSLPFDDTSAEEYGKIRADLSRQGQPIGRLIGPNDLLIASIAKAFDVILVTNNTREFSRISGLRLVDWQE